MPAKAGLYSPQGSLLFKGTDARISTPSYKRATRAALTLAASASATSKRATARLKIPNVTFYCLRQTHASQSVASGMKVLTISRRLGHGSPITLVVYGRPFANTDARGCGDYEGKIFGFASGLSTAVELFASKMLATVAPEAWKTQ